MIQEVHPYGAPSYASYTNMTEMAMPHVCGIIITKFASLGINTMEMCVTTIEIQ